MNIGLTMDGASGTTFHCLARCERQETYMPSICYEESRDIGNLGFLIKMRRNRIIFNWRLNQPVCSLYLSLSPWDQVGRHYCTCLLAYLPGLAGLPNARPCPAKIIRKWDFSKKHHVIEVGLQTSIIETNDLPISHGASISGTGEWSIGTFVRIVGCLVSNSFRVFTLSLVTYPCKSRQWQCNVERMDHRSSNAAARNSVSGSMLRAPSGFHYRAFQDFEA